jgi:3-oxoacyl-(acyl-carrier-protein) synthase III
MSTFLIDIPVPSMGATVNELTLIDLLVAPGSSFTKGEKLAEFESDKSVFDFEAPCDGSAVRIYCRPGDIVPVNTPFLRVQTEDTSLKHLEVSDAELSPSVAVHKAVASVGEIPISAPSSHSTPTAVPSKAGAGSRLKWTPRALKIAREAGLDPETLAGVSSTGPGGRVSGDDIEKYISEHGAATKSPGPSVAPARAESSEDATVCLAGIGYAVPRNVRSNAEILKAFPGKTEEEILRITGIRQRHYATGGESATSLATIAVNHALSMSGVNLSEVDGIIMATLIPDQPVPSAASALAKELGVRHALAFDLNAACSGWLYALEVGRSLIRAGSAKNLIVVTAELLSRITNPNDFATAFLFGDGAGAAILTDSPGGHRLDRMKMGGDAQFYECIQRTGGGALLPVPNPDSDMDQFYLQMDGATVFKQAVIAFGRIIEDTLTRHKITAEDVAWVVPHQANERILRAVSKRVGIPYEKFVVTIGKYGNTSAASVSMALGWAGEEGIFDEGDKIVFCSVGAGLTFAGGLLTW